MFCFLKKLNCKFIKNKIPCWSSKANSIKEQQRKNFKPINYLKPNNKKTKLKTKIKTENTNRNQSPIVN